jgi:hypothetical protein
LDLEFKSWFKNTDARNKSRTSRGRWLCLPSPWEMIHVLFCKYSSSKIESLLCIHVLQKCMFTSSVWIFFDMVP